MNNWAPLSKVNNEKKLNRMRSYLLKIVGNKHKIHAAETKLRHTQEDVDNNSEDEKDTIKILTTLELCLELT